MTIKMNNWRSMPNLQGTWQPRSWVEYQNQLWECVYRAHHAKLVQLVDNSSLCFIQMTNPSCSLMVQAALRTCLQTLLYIAWLKKTKQNKVIIAGGRKVDVRHSSNVIYWAVYSKSSDFLPGFSMSELIIPAKHNIIVQFILYRLIQKPNCTPQLTDGVSLLHLIIIVGHMYERVDESINLINCYAVNNPERVDFICPWTKKSTLDLALERELRYLACMLHTMRCRALKFPELEKRIEIKNVATRVPSVDPGDPLTGMVKFNSVLDSWKNCEGIFLDCMKKDIVSKDELEDESSISNQVYTWIQNKLTSIQEKIPFKTKLYTSGSIAEETKIKPIDEVDLVFKCKLDIDLRVTDENSNDDWMMKNTLEPSLAQQQLSKIDSKQPFHELATVVLKADYPGLGAKGGVLTPSNFTSFVDSFINQALSEVDLPENLTVPIGKNFLEQSKSGFLMNLEYECNGTKQELTIDLVTVLVLSRDNYQKVLAVMPKYDESKYKYLQHNNLLSGSDGIIVKNDRWRMSFSNGEKKIIELNKNLYRSLKYLNKCSEHHIDIPTYYLKEIFCCFIVHQGMHNVPLVRPSLALSLAELVAFCDTEVITSPFYCTKHGSKLEKNCAALFRRFKEVFPDKFVSQPVLSAPCESQSSDIASFIAFPRQLR